MAHEEDCDRPPVSIVLLVMALVIAIMATSTWSVSNFSWRKEAVESGHAEWFIEDHVREWRWKSVTGGTPEKGAGQKKCDCAEIKGGK